MDDTRGDSIKCKCERCGRIRDLFQYTRYEEKWVEWVEKRNAGRADKETVYVAHRKDIGEKRGLCEECAVEINKRKYDTQPN